MHNTTFTLCFYFVFICFVKKIFFVNQFFKLFCSFYFSNSLVKLRVNNYDERISFVFFCVFFFSLSLYFGPIRLYSIHRRHCDDDGDDGDLGR